MGSFQSTVAQRADALPPAGSRWGAGHPPPRYGQNDRPNTAGATDFTITAVNSTLYRYTIGGINVEFTSDATATIAEIQTGLIAAHVAQQAAFPLSQIAKTTAAAVGNAVRVTETDPASGAVSMTDADANLASSVVTAHSNEESVNAGRALVQGSDAGGVRLPATGATTFVGIAEKYQLGAELELIGTATMPDLYRPNSQIPVGYRGAYVVEVEGAVTLAGNVFFRHAPSGANLLVGKFRADNDGGNATQVTGARWLTTTSGAGRAVLAINLT